MSVFRSLRVPLGYVQQQNAIAQRCAVVHQVVFTPSAPRYRSESTPMRGAAAQSNFTLSESLSQALRSPLSSWPRLHRQSRICSTRLPERVLNVGPTKMIDSKLANLLIVLLGIVLTVFGIAAIVESVSAGAWAGDIFAVVFSLSLGSWCLGGGVRNLRKLDQPPPPLMTYRVAKWNVFAICTLLPACFLVGFFEPRLHSLGVPETVGAVICGSFGIALLIVPFVLLVHRAVKAKQQPTGSRFESQAG